MFWNKTVNYCPHPQNKKLDLFLQMGMEVHCKDADVGMDVMKDRYIPSLTVVGLILFILLMKQLFLLLNWSRDILSHEKIGLPINLCCQETFFHT